MKIAIIGHSYAAYGAASRFLELGAQVHHYSSYPFLWWSDFLSGHFPQRQFDCRWRDILSVVEQEWFKRQDNGQSLDDFINAKSYHELYALPYLDKSLNLIKYFRQKKVGRIHKRFFSKDGPQGKERLNDLFRVVTNDTYDYLPQKLEEGLKEADKNHLKSEIESYEDYDLVITAQDLLLSRSMTSSGALAMGQVKASKQIYSGLDAFFYLEKIKQNKHVTIIGEDNETIYFLKLLQQSILSDQLEVFVIHPSKLMGKGEEAIDTLRSFSLEIKEKINSEREQFEIRHRRWVQEKKGPKPPEPHACVQKMSGYQVLSIDQLSDREGLFITYEASNNDQMEIITKQSQVLINLGREVIDLSKTAALNISSIPEIINPLEPGFYCLNNEATIDHQVKVIIDNVLTFYSKA